MNERILVAGATGGLGRHLVQQLKARDYQVRALVRDETKVGQLLGTDVEIVVGDTRHYQTLPPALAGIRRLVCATDTHQFQGPNSPKHVDYEGVCHLTKAATEAGIDHFVLVSSIGVTQPDHPLNRLGQVLTWKLKEETCLRAKR